MKRYDAVIVGSGPNGLAAAITLLEQGRSVLVIEGKDTPGGGLRSAETTLPGFTHDICSAIHPLGMASPFFRSQSLEQHGLRWVFPPAQVAHPLDDGSAVIFERSLDATAASMGRDAAAYRRLIGPHVGNWKNLIDQMLGPLRFPRRPLRLALFGLPSLLPATILARLAFRGERARAAFAGMAAHSMLALETPISGAFGMMMSTMAHAVGYPMAEGGSQAIANALVARVRALGGEIVTGTFIRSMNDLPQGSKVLFDVTPRQLLRIAGDRLDGGYRRKLERYRYGVGVFKLDFALDGPIPWTAKEVCRAATVHLGGTLEEIAASESAIWRGENPRQPYVLLAQQSLFDPTRAPAGKHTVWAYCHTTNGSAEDMTSAIEDQIERFAPGFRARILARHTTNALEMERYNPNYIGGDINGGVQDIRQFFTRPVASLQPYRTSDPDLYLCSSSTPPGGGVHGMCGVRAARSVRF
jgi:phytoene dehydrogenase-like protein